MQQRAPFDPPATTASFSAPMTLSGAATIANNSVDATGLSLGDDGFGLSFRATHSGFVAVSGIISGAGSIQTTLLLVLSGHNTYTGPTSIVSPRVITMHDPQALGASGPGNGTIVSGGIVQALFASSGTVDEAFAFSNSSQLVGDFDSLFTAGISLCRRSVGGDERRRHPRLRGTADRRHAENQRRHQDQQYLGQVDLHVHQQSPVLDHRTEGAMPADAIVTADGEFALNGFEHLQRTVRRCVDAAERQALRHHVQRRRRQ